MKESFEFIDLFTFDPSIAVDFAVPVDQFKGMILLFPLPEEAKGEGEGEGEKEGEGGSMSEQPKFIKQTIENSCCLMALLHLLLNNPRELLTESCSEIIKNLQSSSSGNELLIENSSELKQIHDEIAKIGETNVPEIDENVPFHFVSLIPFNGSIWLMDGRRAGPVEFKSTRNFFETACKIANEEFVQKSDDQTNFAAVILV